MTEKNQPNKKCPFCAENILSDAVKCKHCGEWLKKQTVDSSTEQKKQKQFSKVVPTGKFILLSVITFGIYELVWFYRNWNLLKEDKGLKISPFWRAFFAPFFAGSIAGHLQKYLKEKDIHLEVCPTSNIKTGIYPKLANHNIDKIYRSGVSLSVNTDGRSLSNVSLFDEYKNLNTHFDWKLKDYLATNLFAIEAAFVDEEIKEKLKKRILNNL